MHPSPTFQPATSHAPSSRPSPRVEAGRRIIEQIQSRMANPFANPHASPHSPTAEREPLPEGCFFVGTLPYDWVKGFGYQGRCRWVSVWWEPGDGPCYSDGHASFTGGETEAFLSLMREGIARAIVRAHGGDEEARWLIGSHDTCGSHVLLLDTRDNRVFLGEKASCERFMRERNPVAESALPEEEKAAAFPTGDIQIVGHAMAPLHIGGSNTLRHLTEAAPAMYEALAEVDCPQLFHMLAAVHGEERAARVVDTVRGALELACPTPADTSARR